MATFKDMTSAVGKSSAIKKNSEYYGGANLPRGHDLEAFASVLSSVFNRNSKNTLEKLREQEVFYYEIGQRR